MSKSTISTFDFFARFRVREAARLYLELRLCPGGLVCAIQGNPLALP